MLALNKALKELKLTIGDLYDKEDGHLIINDKNLRIIQSIQNLNDDIQFCEILNYCQFDKYWYLQVDKTVGDTIGYVSYCLRFYTVNQLSSDVCNTITNSLVMNNKSKHYLYHVNEKMFEKEDYNYFLNDVMSTFRKTLSTSVYNTYLTRSSFNLSDYTIDETPLKKGVPIKFKCIVDLDDLNNQPSTTPLSIVNVEVMFGDNMVDITFSLPDIIVPGPSPRMSKSLKRDSIEDRTVAKSIEEFYIKLFFESMKKHLTERFS